MMHNQSYAYNRSKVVSSIDQQQPRQRLVILVPKLQDDDHPTATTNISTHLWKLWKILPLPLRIICCIYIVNVIYITCFASNHFADNNLTHNRSLLKSQTPYQMRTPLIITQKALSKTINFDQNKSSPVLEYDNLNHDDAVLVVIVSDRLQGIIPTVSSILTHTKSKPVDLVLIGNNLNVNERVKQHFMNSNHSTYSTQHRASIRKFTSLSIKEVQDDLIRQGYKPIWTWPEWGSSRNSSWFQPNYTLHVADWDQLETHAHELNHLRFYLPLVSQFQHHKYLYFLDDDILVQKDLGYIADVTMKTLDPSKGLVTPCNIWIWNSECHRFGFENEDTISSILQAPSLYGDRHICHSDAETHCYPASYTAFLESVIPNGNMINQVGNTSDMNNPRKQKAWNFGFSLFALDYWRKLDLTSRYEFVMKKSYRLHVFPETSLTFGLGVSYIAFAGAVECWDDDILKVRDGFGFIEWNRFSQTFGSDFLKSQVDVIHYTGPTKPWIANTTIEPRSLQPWLDYMGKEGMVIPEQLPIENGNELFTLLGSDRTGAQWIMATLDNHPNICASGEGQKPESGFPSDVMLPMGTPWFPICSVKRGCSFAFVHDAILDLAESMDMRGRTNRVPPRCQPDYKGVDADVLGHHLPRICQFFQSLNGNYTDAAIAAKWVDAFRDENQDLLGCSCPRGTSVKGVKVFTEWLLPQNYPRQPTGPPDLILDSSAIHGSKIIRLKRRNLFEQYMSSILAQKSNMYHISSPGDKITQLQTAGKFEISIEEMLWKISNMKAIDSAGDTWAQENGSDVLEIYYEDCRDDASLCFRKIFDFLGVDSLLMSTKKKLFESSFRLIWSDSTLDQIVNKVAVQEALAVNGYGEYVGMANFTKLQLLIYDDSETIDRTHQFHQEEGINAIMFGRKYGAHKKYITKFAAAVPLLKSMTPDTVVVLSDSRDVRIQFPPGSDFLRYEAISNFRKALRELTRGYPGTVVVSTESYCCASALTHAKPGDFYHDDGRRKHRSCISSQSGCEWAGDDKSLPWQAFMNDTAKRLGHLKSDNIYLDGGLIGGKAEDMLAFIRATNIGEAEDDRAVLTDFMYQYPGKIVLDYEQRVFGKNRQSLRGNMNNGCPFKPSPETIARRLYLSNSTDAAPLFMHTPRELGCTLDKVIVDTPIFPNWDDDGIQIGPILDHIDRVATENATITSSVNIGEKPVYYQGPEIPYFPDESGVWTSKLIRDRTDNATMIWRTKPTEVLIYKAHQILKNNQNEQSRWSTLRKTLKSGGFPYWAWYGDFKSCNFHNYQNTSIPLFTPSVPANCSHTFPVPNYMNIIDSQPTSDNWRGVFRDKEVLFPWTSKIRKVVWRGSLSEANGDLVLQSVRWRANKLIYRLNSSLYDVGLTGIPPWVANQVTLNVSEVGGLKKGIAPMSDFQRYKAILDMDGNSWSSRYATLLCYNSVVIKVAPKHFEYFYSTLQPWTHYIPVRDDLSDLHENVAWALDPTNDALVRNIVTSANEWCSQRMVPAELANDLLDIWESYVLHLYRADPNWQEQWKKKKSIILSSTSNLNLHRLRETE